jgi:hypothetical protein
LVLILGPSYVMAEFVAANMFSAVLFIGNPTNIVLAEAFDLNFADCKEKKSNKNKETEKGKRRGKNKNQKQKFAIVKGERDADACIGIDRFFRPCCFLFFFFQTRQ